LAIACVSRLVLIALLFLSADASSPYATLFGDEEIFKSRTIWLRNVGLGVPISPADFIYAFDDTGKSGHLFVLAFVQALVGDAPYGVHVLNAAVYVTAALVMYRFVRPAYGRMAALAGLTVLLFLPSLFSWSISALKEPIYTLVAVGELLCVMAAVRAPRIWQRGLAVAGVVVLAVSLESLRQGTLLVAVLGSIVGVAAGLVIRRPRALLAAMVVLPIALLAVLSLGAVQDRLLGLGREAARYHAGHVLTVGNSYQILDRRYYSDWVGIQNMTPPDVVAFSIRSVASYFSEPVPWRLDSPYLLAYLPEQIAWWTLMALVPFGIVAGLRRDALLTTVLAAHAAAIVMMVALTSGNIGTLIRHRGLVLPYLVWLSALGGYDLLRRLAPPPTMAITGTTTHADR
jgi:hypothetical protein